MLAKEPSLDDIVIIATPPSSHAELTIAALRSGRHVLCEKPLAMDVAQAKQMLDVAIQQRRLLGCCSTRFLGLPATEEVRRMIKEHLLGDIYHMTFVNPLAPEDAAESSISPRAAGFWTSPKAVGAC